MSPHPLIEAEWLTCDLGGEGLMARDLKYFFILHQNLLKKQAGFETGGSRVAFVDMMTVADEETKGGGR